jgi:hypothetical protein
MFRVGRQFERLEAERLQHMQQAEIGWRLDRDRVARPSDRLERQRQGLGTAAGDDDIFGRPALSPAERAPANLLPKRRIAPGRGVDVVVDPLTRAARARNRSSRPAANNSGLGTAQPSGTSLGSDAYSTKLSTVAEIATLVGVPGGCETAGASSAAPNRLAT